MKWTAAVEFLDGEESRESSEHFGRLFMESSGVGKELCCARRVPLRGARFGEPPSHDGIHGVVDPCRRCLPLVSVKPMP